MNRSIHGVEISIPTGTAASAVTTEGKAFNLDCLSRQWQWQKHQKHQQWHISHRSERWKTRPSTIYFHC